MADYQVFFEMAEIYWYRYDVEAGSPEEAYEKARELMQTSPVDPDAEIYDHLMGPFTASVEDVETNKVLYEIEMNGGQCD